MKEDNEKRWFYDLTKKQVYKIMLICDIIYCIIMSCTFIPLLWSDKQSLSANLLMAIVIMAAGIFAIGVWIDLLLWDHPGKQYYLFLKEHEEKIIPEVRKKFGLSPDFKEVLPKSQEAKLLCYHTGEKLYYAKEIEDRILISIRDKNGTELAFTTTNNYYAFDLDYKPKV